MVQYGWMVSADAKLARPVSWATVGSVAALDANALENSEVGEVFWFERVHRVLYFFILSFLHLVCVLFDGVDAAPLISSVWNNPRCNHGMLRHGNPTERKSLSHLRTAPRVKHVKHWVRSHEGFSRNPMDSISTKWPPCSLEFEETDEARLGSHRCLHCLVIFGNW